MRKPKSEPYKKPRFNLEKLLTTSTTEPGKPKLRYEPRTGFTPIVRPVLCPACISIVMNFGPAYACLSCVEKKAILPRWATHSPADEQRERESVFRGKRA